MKPIIAPYKAPRQTNGPAPRGPARHASAQYGPARYGPVKRHALIAITALAAALTGHPASATTVDDEANQAVVHYSDLDLSRPEGARRLYGRIQRAAHQVCEAYRSADLQGILAYRQCMQKAVADAVTKLQSAQVTAIAYGGIQHLTKQ